MGSDEEEAQALTLCTRFHIGWIIPILPLTFFCLLRTFVPGSGCNELWNCGNIFLIPTFKSLDLELGGMHLISLAMWKEGNFSERYMAGVMVGVMKIRRPSTSLTPNNGGIFR